MTTRAALIRILRRGWRSLGKVPCARSRTSLRVLPLFHGGSLGKVHCPRRILVEKKKFEP
jgi:hypothetical protein